MSTILIVMAEDDMRETTLKLAEAQGWRAQAVETGEQAMARLRAEEPNLVLTNLMLRGMSGMEVLQAVHQRHPRVMVVVITRYYSVEGAVEVMRSGAYDYIPSETKPQDLVDSLRRALVAGQQTDDRERFRKAWRSQHLGRGWAESAAELEKSNRQEDKLKILRQQVTREHLAKAFGRLRRTQRLSAAVVANRTEAFKKWGFGGLLESDVLSFEEGTRFPSLDELLNLLSACASDGEHLSFQHFEQILKQIVIRGGISIEN